MSFLQERETRTYFSVIVLTCVCFVLFGALSGLSQTADRKALLHERELTLTAALLDRGMPPREIAEVLQNSNVSSDAKILLSKLGRNPGADGWLLAQVRARTAKTALLGLLSAGLLAAVQLAAAVHFFCARDRQLRAATATAIRYADGDFRQRLPRAGGGAQGHLFAAVDQLATALQAKSESEHKSKEFLKATISDISHQLKTPISALQMYIEIIAAEPDNPETVRVFTGKSLASLARMEGLTGTLLKLARLDAGSIVFAPERVKVAALAERAASDLLTRAAHEGKALTLEGNPEAVLHCDPAWTAEALGNLIKNALDHTKKGDKIQVLWEHSPAMLRITVRDTGEGIAPADLHHVFKRFYRAPGSSPQGTGLGLPLARAIIEGQDGLLSVQSEPGAGAAFTAAFLTKL